MNFENQILAKDIQKSFLSLLNDYLPKDILDKARSGQTVKILSIACGRFREAKSICDYFSGHEKFIRLYGIEIDKELINLAKEEPVVKENKNIVFLKHADASNINSYNEWFSDGQFDLIIIRHPEITFNTNIFIKIFSLCAELLKDEGYLIVTTHFENEKEMLKLLFQLNKLKVFIEKENLLSPSTEIKGETRYADKFLLIAKKYNIQ